jgi:hypothetical protein
MNKLPGLLVASALLTAACGAAATPSSSSAQPASIAGVRVNAGPNANADISEIMNRPNPSTHPGGSTQTRPAAPAPPAPPLAARASEPSQLGGWDRCGGGIGVELAGKPGQKRPLPDCAVQ